MDAKTYKLVQGLHTAASYDENHLAILSTLLQQRKLIALDMVKNGRNDNNTFVYKHINNQILAVLGISLE